MDSYGTSRTDGQERGLKGQHEAVLKYKTGAKIIQDSGFSKDYLSHVPMGKEKGSEGKNAYLIITIELNV